MMKLSMAAAALAALTLAACDQSPQSADGAVAEGDVGVAAATNGTLADTGKDIGGADIGGAGEATGGDETAADTNATNATTNAPAP